MKENSKTRSKEYIQGYKNACIDILEEAEKIDDTYIITILKKWLNFG